MYGKLTLIIPHECEYRFTNVKFYTLYELFESSIFWKNDLVICGDTWKFLTNLWVKTPVLCINPAFPAPAPKTGTPALESETKPKTPKNCVSHQRLMTRMHARMHVCWCSQVFARNAKVKNLNSSQLQKPLIFLSDRLSSPHCTNATACKWKVLVHTWSQCSSWRARVLWKLTKIDALKSWIWYLSYEHMPLSQTACWLHLVPAS